MRKVWWILVCAAALGAVVGFAQTPSVPPLTNEALAAILGPAAASGGSCPKPTPESGGLFAPRRSGSGFQKTCSATANCASGTVSCQYNGSGGTCSFADRNCDVGERGHVTCQGTTTNCPTTCPCGSPMCCVCDSTGDCFACCKCGGGSGGQCAQECS